jgi:hypothetical protein
MTFREITTPISHRSASVMSGPFVRPTWPRDEKTLMRVEVAESSGMIVHPRCEQPLPTAIACWRSWAIGKNGREPPPREHHGEGS